MSRIALVTGGTRGIGASIAENLLSHGYEVVVSYHTHQEVADDFTKKTGIKAYKWDVSHFGETEDVLKTVVKQVGPIDVLVNNAGITRDAFFHKMTFEQWKEVIETNLTSCFNVTHVLIPSMIERGFGRIINISSVNAQKGQAGQTNYCAAKAGLIGFTKALAQETASKGITVNAVAPGYTDTEMTRAISSPILEKIIHTIPLKHLCPPEDIARAVCFLAADASGYITGTTLSINGGLYYA